MKIPFNKPTIIGKELEYIKDDVESGKISGDGYFTKKCQNFFEEKYNIKKALLTTSCTDALEMAAILINIQAGDEVIVPSYTFVSTANAFVLRGAKIVFVDSNLNNPNINTDQIESLVTDRTKAIVVVHYAGVACEMDKIMAIAEKYHLFVVEDAAQAIDGFYKGKSLGSIGHFGTFSFHETKNIISGEGGLLAINDNHFIQRAEIIREKGTNRSAFFRGEVDKYGWIDIGSSFLPSDIIAAYLWAQLENLEVIQAKRKTIWQRYYETLKPLAMTSKLCLPHIPNYATNNGHMFYLVCNSLKERSNLIEHLKQNNVKAVFHYLSLHTSPYYKNKYNDWDLPNSDRYTDCLLRLPMYYELSLEQCSFIANLIYDFYEER